MMGYRALMSRSPSQTLLRGLAVPEACIASKTAAEEHRRSFRLLLAKGQPALRVRVDGCWLSAQQGRKVDYLFLVDLPGDVLLYILVELKGGHYGEALEQLKAMLVYLDAQKTYHQVHPRQLVAYVVLSHGNQVGRYQAQEMQLRRRYGIEIRRTSQRGEYPVSATA